MKRKFTAEEEASQASEKKAKNTHSQTNHYENANTVAKKFEDSLLRVCSLAESIRIFEVCFLANGRSHNIAALISIAEQILKNGNFELNKILQLLGDKKIEVIHRSVVLDKNNLKISEKKTSVSPNQLTEAHKIILSACQYLKIHHPGFVEQYFTRQLNFYRGQTEFKLSNSGSEFQKDLAALLSNCQLLLCKSPIDSAKIVEYLFQTNSDLAKLVDSVSLALFVGRDISTVINQKRQLRPDFKPLIDNVFVQLSHKFFEFRYNLSLSQGQQLNQTSNSSVPMQTVSDSSSNSNTSSNNSNNSTNGLKLMPPSNALTMSPQSNQNAASLSSMSVFSENKNTRVKMEDENATNVYPYLDKTQIEIYADLLRGKSKDKLACAKYALAMIKLFHDNYLPPEYKVDTSPGTDSDCSVTWQPDKIKVKTEKGLKARILPVTVTELSGELFDEILPPTTKILIQKDGNMWIDKEVIDVENQNYHIPCIHYKNLEKTLKEKIKSKNEALIGSIVLFEHENKQNGSQNAIADKYEVHIVPFRADQNEIIFVDCALNKGKRVFHKLEDAYLFSGQTGNFTKYKVNLAVVEHCFVKINKELSNESSLRVQSKGN